jgi:hypothetical protein
VSVEKEREIYYYLNASEILPDKKERLPLVAVAL